MFNKSLNSIIYISNVGYKQHASNASINRIRAVQKGCLKLGTNCELFFLYPKDKFNFFESIFFPFFSIWNMLMKTKKGDVVIFYGNSLYILLLFFFRKKIKFYVERTEYPYYMINKGKKISKSAVLKEKLSNYVLNHVEGLITCSSALKEFYSKYIDSEKILIIPFIVDVEKFSKKETKSIFTFEYIAYCGSFNNNKDGLPILIKSFANISSRFPYLKLVIIGGGSKPVENKIKTLVKDLKIENKVVFTGVIAHDEMPNYLCNAKVLALARPNNKQAEGGIPSKVGEYLSTGIPTVVTNVGELSLFLENRVNCIMVEPDSVTSFSSGLEEALLSVNAIEMGSKAKETVKRFSPIAQADRLINFIIHRNIKSE